MTTDAPPPPSPEDVKRLVERATRSFLRSQRERSKALAKIRRGGTKHAPGATKPLPGRDKAKAKAARNARRKNR